ncbi:MAG: hypothetical protein AAFR59_11655, partial [Bacteroidota bacterium]
MNQKSYFLNGLCLCLLSLSFAFAQSATADRIAIAYPMADIQLDGKIDDWTGDYMKYPINKPLFGAKAGSADDFSAYYMCGYRFEENALLLAIVIKDDMEVVAEENPAWNNQDVYTLYLNEAYHIKGSGVARYTLRDTYRDLTDISNNWDPQLEKYLDWDKVEMAMQRVGQTTIYELKVRLSEPIYDGRIIGIGQMITDQDKEEANTIYGWIGRGGKSSSPQPGRIGMLIFQKRPGKMGRIKGKVTWKDPETPTKPEGIHIVSEKDPNFWMYLPVNEAYEFEAPLPAGGYRLMPGKIAFFDGGTYFKADAAHTQSFEVKAGKQIELPTYKLQPVAKPEFPQKGNLLSEWNAQSPAQVDAAVQSYMDYYRMEGVAFAAFKNGEIIYSQTYGV